MALHEAVCAHCGAPLVLRTAKKGPNAGGQFWGCSGWKPGQQHTTLPLEAVDPTQKAMSKPRQRNQASKASTTVKSQPRHRKVAWLDPVQREGWTARFVAGSAALRCWPEELRNDARAYPRVLWVAVQQTDSYAPAEAPTQRVLAMLAKLLRRGDACPVPVGVEAALLDLADSAYRIEAGSTVPLPVAPLPETLGAAFRSCARDELDAHIRLDSDEERTLLERLLVENGTGMGVLPQASLDGLLRARGESPSGSRRVDFLIEREPGSWQALEVDGQQHESAIGVDAERDAALARVGVTVDRVPAAGVSESILPVVSAAVSDEATQFEPLVHGTMASDALAAGLVEGMRRGFLMGAEWCIELLDSTGFALAGASAYLELLTAVDQLWAGDVGPELVTFRRGRGATSFARSGLAWDSTSDHLAAVDMRLHVEAQHSPLHQLPPLDSVPSVVIRTARLPVSLLTQVQEPPQRVPANLAAADVPSVLAVVLREVFGKESFREGQLEAVTELLAGGDCVVLLPTGAGKSLVYQLAGLILPGRTLVIDPIVALMEDQLRGLSVNGIDRAVGISSQTTASGGIEAALDEVASGDALFVFIAPERLQQQSFRDALRSLAQSTPINLVTIDEAHCVSEWGHDFRPAYLNLGNVSRAVCRDGSGAAPPLLALTGTASRAVLRDVLAELAIVERSPTTLIRPRSFDRSELHYSVVRGRPSETLATLEGAVRGLPGRFGVPSEEFFASQGARTYSGLVFCPHTNGEFGVLKVAERLARVTGATVLPYAGSAPKSAAGSDWETVKRQNAADFVGNRVPMLVSTKAFGMGIDKPNVRYVVHLGIPGSIESFYQEVGRAGRDGRPAETVLVFTETSEADTRRKLDDAVDLEVARVAASKSSRAASDDIDRQLFFHLSSFTGRANEIGTLRQVLDELGNIGHATTVGLSRVEKERERAIHRLVVLGVVRDYRVDWGGDRYDVDLADVTADGVRSALIGFVERTQPGRVASMQEALEPRTATKTRDVVDACADLLVSFVYDTIEKSRRRSLREMWLAARESSDDAEMRRRILEYLTEGDLSQALVRLAETKNFEYAPWLDLMRDHPSVADARELRGSAARLLASYPDNPGLLAVRSLTELLDPQGDMQEAANSLGLSARSALGGYAQTSSQVEAAFERMLRLLEHVRRPSEAGLVAAVGTSQIVGWRPAPGPWQRSSAGAVVDLERTLREFGATLDGVIEAGALS